MNYTTEVFDAERDCRYGCADRMVEVTRETENNGDVWDYWTCTCGEPNCSEVTE